MALAARKQEAEAAAVQRQAQLDAASRDLSATADELRQREQRAEQGLAEVERWRSAQADDARLAAAEAEDRADAIVSMLDTD